jgi:hypothetical protein
LKPWSHIRNDFRVWNWEPGGFYDEKPEVKNSSNAVIYLDFIKVDKHLDLFLLFGQVWS